MMKNIEILQVDSPVAGCQLAAQLVTQTLELQPNARLGLATGGTFEGFYRELVHQIRRHDLSLNEVTTFNLDEYYPISPTHPQSYARYMHDHLFQHVDLLPERCHLPKGDAPTAQVACDEYNQRLAKAGPLDLQLLGVGRNGHIGFNEPDDALKFATHLADLAPETLSDNARFFKNTQAMPTQAITVGLGTILTSRSILLLAFGPQKKPALEKLLGGDIDPRWPVSLLKLHPKVTVITDCSLLSAQ